MLAALAPKPAPSGFANSGLPAARARHPGASVCPRLDSAAMLRHLDPSMTEREVPLKGGRITSGVVRIGDTVRRPQGPHSAFVHRLLRHLEASGVACVPRFLGVDARGREILTFIQGEVPSELGHFSDIQLAAGARMLREIHDAAADCDLKGDCETVCHGDAGPCNTVFVNGTPVGTIDFDAARPGFRRQDVGYAAWLWLSIGDERFSPSAQGRRLAVFTRAYGAFDPDAAIPAVLAIQAEFAARTDGHVGLSGWAACCRAWLERHLTEVKAGMTGEPHLP
jgi:phosphotransferase family enzyme